MFLCVKNNYVHILKINNFHKYNLLKALYRTKKSPNFKTINLVRFLSQFIRT